MYLAYIKNISFYFDSTSYNYFNINRDIHILAKCLILIIAILIT